MAPAWLTALSWAALAVAFASTAWRRKRDGRLADVPDQRRGRGKQASKD